MKSLLINGLNALCRSYETDYFRDGHKAAAVMSAVFFTQENTLDDAAMSCIKDTLQRNTQRSALFAPFEAEPVRPDLLPKLLSTVEESLSRLRRIGHNVIFAVTALKAFQQLPETVTAARVEGLMKLIKLFPVREYVEQELDQSLLLPSTWDPSLMNDWVLEHLSLVTERWNGFGNGFSGHLLTFTQAMMELDRLGHSHLAMKGYDAYTMFLRRTMNGPVKDANAPAEKRPPRVHFPLERAYWENHKGIDIGLGHNMKYIYAYYNLSNHCQNEKLKKTSFQASSQIF